MTSLGREIAEGMIEAIDIAKGLNSNARVSQLELPDPAPEFSKEEIKREREKLGMKQREFAALLNVSVKTIEAWEAGKKHPGPPAKRLLQIISDPLTSEFFLQISQQRKF